MTGAPGVPDAMRMPTLFVAHGTPMNAIEPNPYRDIWRGLGTAMPRPRAVLVISAHWYTRGTAVTAMAKPRTIHDFGGFPPALFAVQYPALGDPPLAARVRELLAPRSVHLDDGWGFDHGTWSVLMHMYPAADVPIVQLSIDATQPGAYHYDIGRALAPLRDAGVLILGSGNVVHNLRLMRREDAAPFDWASRFEARVKAAVVARDHAPLVDYERLDADGARSIPTPDHYLPLLYVLGAQAPDETTSFPSEGITMSSLSMLSVAFGMP